MENIFPDFKEWFELLGKRKVEYLIVGGYAVAFYGAPRFTGDIDIFIRTDHENIARLLTALDDFGFGDSGLSAEILGTPGQIIELGLPPVRIDIVTSIQGVSFDQAWPNRIVGRYGDTEVTFIGERDLVLNKRAAGRKKDLADLESLGVDV